ncbi:hypothetical protein [Thomasclavelia sp.]|uniref:hypothetical protein n=1 Tax=Thomasclavelia sp. TaxID=3025757 RepID=UPI0025EBBB7C|nr:hypothetical protein [Thomasclavelia sp.]
MNILDKYSKKKTIYLLATISSGFMTVMWLLDKMGFQAGSSSSLDNLAKLGSLATLIQVIFYLLMAAAVITAILSAYYFFTKDKQDYIMLGELIGSGISSVLLLLSMSGINFMCKVIRLASSGDYSSLYSLDMSSAQEKIMSAGSNLENYMYVCIAFFIFNMVVLLIVKNVIKLNNFNYTLNDGPAFNNFNGDYQNTTPNNGFDTTNNTYTGYAGGNNQRPPRKSFKEFIATKNGKITVGVVALVAVAFIGYLVYDKFFNFTEIDLASNITCEFYGKDGQGYLTDVKNDIDYDKNNEQLANFVNTTSLDYEVTRDLSNGDKVTITVKYSKETADANKIKVTNDSKTFTVKGLIERYKKASSLPDDLVDQLESEADDKAADVYDDGYSTTYSTSLDSLWFAKGDDEDIACAVYKVDETYTSYSGEVTQKTYYSVFYSGTEIDSAYLDDDDHYWYSRYSSLKDSQGNELTTSDGVEDALKDIYDDYSVEKIK